MTSKDKTYSLDSNNLDNKKSRLEFAIEKIEEYRRNDYKGTVSIPLEESLSIEETICIEESYFEIHDNIECEGGCESCWNYGSNQCIKILIHMSNGRDSLSGDEWSEGINSIDNCLEDKRRGKIRY